MPVSLYSMSGACLKVFINTFICAQDHDFYTLLGFLMRSIVEEQYSKYDYPSLKCVLFE